MNKKWEDQWPTCHQSEHTNTHAFETMSTVIYTHWTIFFFLLLLFVIFFGTYHFISYYYVCVDEDKNNDIDIDDDDDDDDDGDDNVKKPGTSRYVSHANIEIKKKMCTK